MHLDLGDMLYALIRALYLEASQGLINRYCLCMYVFFFNQLLCVRLPRLSALCYVNLFCILCVMVQR